MIFDKAISGSGRFSRYQNLVRSRLCRAPSIRTRLVAIVLATGLIAFALIGGIALIRLDLGLKVQADAFGSWSEQQLADRLDGEAQLARARLEVLGAEMSQYLRQVAQRSDVAKAVASANDITIRELLIQVLTTSDIRGLIAVDEAGRVIGANAPPDLLAVNANIQALIGNDLRRVLKDNNRSRPHGYEAVGELPPALLATLNWAARLPIAHISLEPVFDEFGELIGALVAIRPLAKVEPTLEHFSTLSNAGVVVLQGGEIVSAAGPANVKFAAVEPGAHALARSSDKAHVARCAEYEGSLKVCTFTDASVLRSTRDRVFKIGAEQTQFLMRQFLISAAATLGFLVVAILFGVRHAMRGLSTLASAANAVAGGDVNVPFKAQGVGEVYSLSVAFEQMLANLRASMKKISELAFFDTVTGLSNREKIRTDAVEIIRRSKCGTLFFIDLDGFKAINDTFGHRTGDLLLKNVAGRLTESLAKKMNGIPGPRPTIGRVGGDEFVVLAPGVEDETTISDIAKYLIQVLRAAAEILSPSTPRRLGNPPRSEFSWKVNSGTPSVATD
ncbi:MAG: diguanylate cyclase domain-containing protein [Pseudolabrys sp.]